MATQIQTYADSSVAIFILNFTSEEFFRVRGEVQMYRHLLPPISKDEVAPIDYITINGQPYNNDIPFAGMHIEKGDKTAFIIVYGEPLPEQIEYMLKPLLED